MVPDMLETCLTSALMASSEEAVRLEQVLLDAVNQTHF